MTFIYATLVALAWFHFFEGRYLTFFVCLIAGCNGAAA